MKQLRIAAALVVAVLVSCVSLAQPGTRYYVSKPVYSFADSTADRVTVYVDEKTLFQINALLLVGRRQQVEQAACLRVAKHHGSTFWVDSMRAAFVLPNSQRFDQITFGCDHADIPLHYHVSNDEWECEASSADTGPAWSIYPAAMVSCGVGIDSLVAWHAKPLERR